MPQPQAQARAARGAIERQRRRAAPDAHRPLIRHARRLPLAAPFPAAASWGAGFLRPNGKGVMERLKMDWVLQWGARRRPGLIRAGPGPCRTQAPPRICRPALFLWGGRGARSPRLGRPSAGARARRCRAPGRGPTEPLAMSAARTGRKRARYARRSGPTSHNPRSVPPVRAGPKPRGPCRPPCRPRKACRGQTSPWLQPRMTRFWHSPRTSASTRTPGRGRAWRCWRKARRRAARPRRRGETSARDCGL